MPALHALRVISEAGYVQCPNPVALIVLRWLQIRAHLDDSAITPDVGSQRMLQACWQQGSMPALQAVGAISEAGYVQCPDPLTLMVLRWPQLRARYAGVLTPAAGSQRMLRKLR
jgi:hypothetical protein